MASRNRKKDRTQERIRSWVNQVGKVEIKKYSRDIDLTGSTRPSHTERRGAFLSKHASSSAI